MNEYDWSGEYDDAYGIRETFTGTWGELKDYIKEMRADGCYNITANCINEFKGD